MSEKTVNNDERVSFILYKSYIKQVRMLSNEQAGEWIKSVYEYVCTGTYEESDDFGVELMISLICNQLDVDARKYEETRERRREAGRKGGYQKAKNNSIAKNATNELANVAEKEIENEFILDAFLLSSISLIGVSLIIDGLFLLFINIYINTRIKIYTITILNDTVSFWIHKNQLYKINICYFFLKRFKL